MSVETMSLEKQLTVEKAQLRTSLESIGHRASEAVDWRHHVRTRPVETLGAAMVLGAVVGALTARAQSPKIRPMREQERVGEPRGQLAPEWHRLKAGLIGMVTDRAMVAAQEFIDHATRPREASSRPTSPMNYATPRDMQGS